MCGLAGFWDRRCLRFEPLIFSMTNGLRHRGPDGAGYWCDGREGVALGHRRLAIQDLSEAGRQPMFSASGRYCIVYNGEIYNFCALREEIHRRQRDYPFRGGSDTEVLLGALEVFGIQEGIEKCIGMFAFALWDREERKLYLVRDRLGIKPLYVAPGPERLLFGSELKALLAHPGMERKIDPQGLSSFFRYSQIPAPATIYEGIEKIRPGEIRVYSEPGAPGRSIQYYRPEEVVAEGVRFPFLGSPEEGIEELDRLLRDAIGLRMVADVELGAFLSGGIDSSTVVALLQALSARPVKTFSIGSSDKAYDEGHAAAAVAHHLGCDHQGLEVSPGTLLDALPRLMEVYDEPFADPSQLPTYLVSALARKKVTVSLSGDGGDELFGGYNRHKIAPHLERFLEVPRPVRTALGEALQQISPRRWDVILEGMAKLGGHKGVRLGGDKVHKFAQVIGCADEEEMYQRLLSHWEAPEELVINGETGLRRYKGAAEVGSLALRWMYRDLVSYLPDDILTKVDRASMAVALEARVPLLDHRVLEFAWRLPEAWKLGPDGGKWILRQVLYRYVPRGLVDRPKMGFGIPLDDWLRGDLRSWARDLLRPKRLQEEGVLYHGKVEKIWDAHQRGQGNYGALLWSVLVFQSWREEYDQPRRSKADAIHWESMPPGSAAGE